MKRGYEGQLKPIGWSWYIGNATRNGFFLGIFGGTLQIRDYQFQEWFFRVPFLGAVLVICHIGSTPELSDDLTSVP